MTMMSNNGLHDYDDLFIYLFIYLFKSLFTVGIQK